jgi:hypothetical protein
MKSKIQCLLVAMVFLSFARANAGQDSKAVKKVEDMNRAAMEDYDLLEFETAKKTLNEALQTIKKAKLDKHVVTARTYMNLAIVLGGGLGDTENATLAMVAALTIDPAIKLDKAYKTPDLQRVFEEARSAVRQAGGGGREESAEEPSGRRGDEGGGDEGGDEEGGDDVAGLKHTPIDEAKGGKPIPVTARVGSDLGAKQIVLFYRAAGAEEFTPVVMKGKGGSTFKAEIPVAATKGDAVHYYIEAKTGAGKIAASAGNSGSPNIVTIVAPGGGEKAGEGGGDDEENPLGDSESSGEGGGDDDADADVEKGSSGSRNKFFLGVSAGTGGGYVSGTTEKEGQPVSCCVAPELLNLKPEIGFWVSPQMVVSAYARIGLPIGVNVEGGAFVAPAGLIRIGYIMDPEEEGGVSLHGDIGGGVTRQTVKLKNSTMVGMDTDTHATGPLLLGGGVGWVKPLGGPARFFIDATALLGIPVVKSLGTAKPGFGISLDLNLGLAMAF